MINNQQEFFQLLKESNELRKDHRYLLTEDSEKRFDELSGLLIENKNKKYQIGRSLMFMYDHCDDYNASILDKVNLRNYTKMLLSELKRA